MYVGVGWK
jgi:hypothetical protein